MCNPKQKMTLITMHFKIAKFLIQLLTQQALLKIKNPKESINNSKVKIQIRDLILTPYK